MSDYSVTVTIDQLRGLLVRVFEDGVRGYLDARDPIIAEAIRRMMVEVGFSQSDIEHITKDLDKPFEEKPVESKKECPKGRSGKGRPEKGYADELFKKMIRPKKGYF